MKKLCDLIECSVDILVSGVETDSRKIKKGDLFVAIKGFNVDHSKFIDDAIKNGCSAVITSESVDVSVPVVVVDDVNKTLVQVLDKFYDNVVDNFNFIGITGTDGKTTTAIITSKILDAAYIGTNGLIYKDYRKTLNNTTPEVCEFYEVLQKLRELGAHLVVMEVSSEALLHGRVDNISFDIAGLTNVTEDHLNIHKSLDNYISSKKKLFSLVSGVSILNRDDDNFEYFREGISNVYTYGKNEKSDYRIKNVKCSLDGSSFDIVCSGNSYHIESELTNLYNVYNLTLSFIISLEYLKDSDKIIEKIKEIKSIEGRGETFDFGQNYKIVLDYAHTYNAIKNIILDEKKFNHNRIIVVTGAAGGREVEKRRKIGKFILDNVDLCIFTMDDPRNEDVNKIIDDMLSDTRRENYLRITDRKDAICKAFSLAEEGDILLILGKGRDNYMAIGDKKIAYSDFDVINNYFNLDNLQ